MSEYGDVSSPLNRTIATFLFTNLHLGETYLELAKVSRIQATVIRNHNNARRVHDTVLRLASRVKLDEAQRQILVAKLAALKERLEVCGEENP